MDRLRIVKKVPSELTRSNHLLYLFRYYNNSLLLSPSYILYQHKGRRIISDYVKEERKKEYDIPENLSYYYSKFGYGYHINFFQVLEYDTPYIFFSDGIKELYALKGNNESYVVQEQLTEGELNEIEVSFDLLKDYFKEENNTYYVIDYDIYGNVSLFSYEELLDDYRSYLFNNAINLYIHRKVKIDSKLLSKITDNVNSINTLPNYYHILNSENIYKIKVKDKKMFVEQILSVIHIDKDRYKIISRDLPVSNYNINDINSMKNIIPFCLPKLDKYMNSHIEQSDIKRLELLANKIKK